MVGGGGHGKVLMSVLRKTGYRVLGYVDRVEAAAVLGIPCIGNDDALEDVRRSCPQCKAAIGVGKVDAESDLRMRLLAMLAHLGFALPAIVSPDATVAEEVSLGAGTVVFDGAVANAGSRVGRAGILNSNSTVEHDCEIGDNVHIAPGATVCGGVVLGDNCMVGAGAVVAHAVSVTAGCLIGAGAVVVRSLAEPGVYVGNPARKIA